jgi:hypothetical protein
LLNLSLDFHKSKVEQPSALMSREDHHEQMSFWVSPHQIEIIFKGADKVVFMSSNYASSNTPKRSAKRSRVAALLYVEAGIVFALGLWLTVLGFTHEEKEMTPLLAEIGFALAGSAGLFACARGYVNGKVYGRSPTILANLIAVGVAYYQIQGAFYIGAAIILSLALPTLYFALAIAKEEG